MQYVKDLKWKYDVLTADPTNEDWASGYKAIATEDAAMYIASPDSADQLALNKMNIQDLAEVPLPAGPGGQFALGGGTPYMFAANATHEQVLAGLKYLVLMGKAPVVTPESLVGLEADAKARIAKGVPILPGFPAWAGATDYLKAQADVQEKNKNVDMKFFNDYFDGLKKPGILHLEEPQVTQDLYKELTNVLQAVITNKNADVTKLMNTANTNVQNLLNNGPNKK
jgi:multiple sugar transport system substrate-binding protein